MKVLYYRNKDKDVEKKYSTILIKSFEKYGIEFSELFDDDLEKRTSASALFVIGGDGTILDLCSFSCLNNIPIIGINAGKVGFLTEFECTEIETAISLFSQSALVTDLRTALDVTFNDKSYIALNEIVIQRVYAQNLSAHIINLDVKINESYVDKIVGDGVIVCTPTGSTAYSLSSNGAILAPGINAFSITPICAHSLHHRPIIYSADSVCEVDIKKNCLPGVFIDGRFISLVSENEKIIISKSKDSVVFLRRNSWNFFDKLMKKLN